MHNEQLAIVFFLFPILSRVFLGPPRAHYTRLPFWLRISPSSSVVHSRDKIMCSYPMLSLAKRCMSLIVSTIQYIGRISVCVFILFNYVYIYMYIHTHIHTYIHTYTQYIYAVYIHTKFYDFQSPLEHWTRPNFEGNN